MLYGEESILKTVDDVPGLIRLDAVDAPERLEEREGEKRVAAEHFEHTGHHLDAAQALLEHLVDLAYEYT